MDLMTQPGCSKGPQIPGLVREGLQQRCPLPGGMSPLLSGSGCGASSQPAACHVRGSATWKLRGCVFTRCLGRNGSDRECSEGSNRRRGLSASYLKLFLVGKAAQVDYRKFETCSKMLGTKLKLPFMVLPGEHAVLNFILVLFAC